MKSQTKTKNHKLITDRYVWATDSKGRQHSFRRSCGGYRDTTTDRYVSRYTLATEYTITHTSNV